MLIDMLVGVTLSPRGGVRLPHGDRVRTCVATALALFLAVAAHVAGGSGLPESAETWLFAVAVAGAGTVLARAVARTTRGAVPTVSILGVCQLAVEASLWSGGQVLTCPLASAGVHVIASIVLAVLLLGGERVLCDLRQASDRLLPRTIWRPFVGWSLVRRVGVVLGPGSVDSRDLGPWLPARGPPPGRIQR